MLNIKMYRVTWTVQVVAIVVGLAVIHAIQLEGFYPYVLVSNERIIANDDASSRLISLQPPLHFYGRTYDECRVGSH